MKGSFFAKSLRVSLIPAFAAGIAMFLSGCRISDPQFTTVAPGLAETAKLETTTITNQIDPAWLQPPTQPYTLGPGDKVELELLGEPTSRSTTVVAPDGKLYFNLLPGVEVWGLTLPQAKDELEAAMSRYVREKPQISLVLREVASKHVWVLGNVQAPGIFPLSAPMTLLEAISLSGGTMSLASVRQMEASGANDELADLQRSFVLRQGRMVPVNFERLLRQGDLSQNIYLQPDDFIYLPAAAAREVYVLGAVTEPRAIPFRQGLTVARAIASAYGTLKGAYLEQVAVVRGSLSAPEIAVVNYRKVIRGEAKDVALESRDIVYVPLSPYRYLTRYAELAVDTFVSSAAINAGTSRIGQPVGGAGIFIPVGSGVRIIPPISPPPIR